ncbi:MAG: LysM peptidoglycan-binding domain-containing protein [Caldilineaceae bacterium]
MTNAAPLSPSLGRVLFCLVYHQHDTEVYTFTPQGIPVRAKVDVTFTQYTDIKDRLGELYQNPTSGGGPINRIHRVVAGDRLDLIAYEVYRDPARWRDIARYNNLTDPLVLRPGQMLTLPFEEEFA